MNTALDRIAKKQREPTPFSQRYIELLKADVLSEICDSVMYNIIDWQWKKVELRIDRQYSEVRDDRETVDTGCEKVSGKDYMWLYGWQLWTV